MSYDIGFGVQTVCENNDGERFEQPPVDRLIRCLENDYGITASWDGLRKVWLTERATLGSGTCEFKPFQDEDASEPNAMRGVCSECSALMYGKDDFCPNCGAKVVSV